MVARSGYLSLQIGYTCATRIQYTSSILGQIAFGADHNVTLSYLRPNFRYSPVKMMMSIAMTAKTEQPMTTFLFWMPIESDKANEFDLTSVWLKEFAFSSVWL